MSQTSKEHLLPKRLGLAAHDHPEVVFIQAVTETGQVKPTDTTLPKVLIFLAARRTNFDAEALNRWMREIKTAAQVVEGSTKIYGAGLNSVSGERVYRFSLLATKEELGTEEKTNTLKITPFSRSSSDLMKSYGLPVGTKHYKEQDQPLVVRPVDAMLYPSISLAYLLAQGAQDLNVPVEKRPKAAQGIGKLRELRFSLPWREWVEPLQRDETRTVRRLANQAYSSSYNIPTVEQILDSGEKALAQL